MKLINHIGLKIALLGVLCLFAQFMLVKEIKYQTGDIIFLSNPAAPDKLLQSITKSKYSHVGLVVKEKGKASVYYTANVVKKVSIPEFLALSGNGKYEVMRFKDSVLISGLTEIINTESKRLLGFKYDNSYSWLDMEIYNTELVWKIYKRAANVELCSVKPLNSLSISDSLVKKKIHTLFGDSISPMIKIVSANDIHDSEFLMKIK